MADQAIRKTKNAFVLSRGRILRRIVFWATGSILLLALLMAYFLQQSYRQYEDQAGNFAQSVTQVLEANLAGIMAKVDVALLAVTDEARRQYARGGIQKDEFDRFIIRQHSRLPEIESFRAADPAGLALYGPDVPVAKTRSLAHRDYFMLMKEKPVDYLVFSEPLVGGISGKWMVLLVRRLERPDGSFGGLVYAGLTLDYLTKAFSAIHLNPGDVITLRDAKLGLIDRFPKAEDPSKTVGTKDVSAQFRDLVASGQNSGTWHSHQDRPHIFSFSRVGTYPFLVSVQLDEREFLGGWFDLARNLLILFAGFVILAVVVGVLSYRSLVRTRQAAETLLLQEEKFRTVADYTYDWEFWLGPDQVFRYTSPSCARISGFDAGRFYDDHQFFESLVHPEDLPAYRAHLARLLEGKEAQVLVFRLVRADGLVRWIEQTCQPVLSETADFLGLRGTNRDITDRRADDEKIKTLLKEKEIILVEVHHRIKNNMSTLASLMDIQAQGHLGATPEQILQTASNRIRSMAVLYEKLYNSENRQSLGLAEYLPVLLQEIRDSFVNPERIKLVLEIENIVLPAEILSRLGIIMNELVSNALKYAFPLPKTGQIAVTAKREGSLVTLTFADNGPGLPADWNQGQAPGFGFRLVEMLVQQFHGQCEIASDQGVRVKIKFAV